MNAPKDGRKQRNASHSKKARGPQLPALDPIQTASRAGLRYVHDSQAGLCRIRCGSGFKYLDSAGCLVRDREVLARIRSLAIPPAWTDVWICSQSNGHLQATGRDARRRKQYRYHPLWRSVRDDTKYHRTIAFGLVLPQIRSQVQADLERRGLPREKVLATIVSLLETTLIRVGNEEYARTNGSFGLTTLRNRHVTVTGASVRFAFRGKSGVIHQVDVHDPRLARVVRRCQDLPGHELFEYEAEDSTIHSVDSADVNDYLRQAAGEEFTAKDFRTWAGTVLAARALREFEPFGSRTQARRNVAKALKTVAQRLGNTLSVCRKCYVHPAIVDAYLEGALKRRHFNHQLSNEIGTLSLEEAAVLKLLQARLRHKSE